MYDEMASNVYPWQHACSNTGAALKVCFRAPEESWSDAIIAATDSTVAVVAICNVHWCDGSFVDLNQISCHLRGMNPKPVLVVDGTQSVGVLPIDVTALEVDYMACSVHKWLLSSHGMSLVYINPRLHQLWRPLDAHERSRIGSDQPSWDEIGTMGASGYPESFMSGARRLDAGGRPNPILMQMLLESLKLLTSTWTPELIHPILTSLTDCLADSLEEDPDFPLKILPKHLRCSHILGIRISDSMINQLNISKIGAELRCRGVIVAIRHGAIRISPYLYITKEDMLCVARHLTDIVRSCIPTRVLITGGNGWLAQHLIHHFQSKKCDHYDFHVTYQELSPRPFWLPESRCHKMSLTKQEYESSSDPDIVIQQIKPAIIIHCAAVSAPALCEKSAFLCAVNAPAALINAVNKYVPSCAVIFTSTDLTFAGKIGQAYPPIDPNDREFVEFPPVNAYGKSKLEFEKLVLSLKNGVVLRLSNMIGPAAPFRSSGSPKFYEFLFKNLKDNISLDLKNDEARSFVYVNDVISVVDSLLLKFCENNDFSFPRVYNVGGPEALTRVDMARLLANAEGIPLTIHRWDIDPHLLHDAQTNTNFELGWRIFSLSSNEFASKNPIISVVPAPLHVEMNSSLTTRYLGVQFENMQNVLNILAKSKS